MSDWSNSGDPGDREEVRGQVEIEEEGEEEQEEEKEKGEEDEERRKKRRKKRRKGVEIPQHLWGQAYPFLLEEAAPAPPAPAALGSEGLPPEATGLGMRLLELC